MNGNGEGSLRFMCVSQSGSKEEQLNKKSLPFDHLPVMVGEIVELAAPIPAGYFLDATVGGGGHSKALLQNVDGLHLVGIDRDPAAIEAAKNRLELFEKRVQLQRGRFDQLSEILLEVGISSLSGFLFDLGVSSPQIDQPSRGFSFRREGPLDMRMDPELPLDAAEVVNSYSHGELARVLRTYGDERYASRIASALLQARPLSTTTELAEVIVEAIPAAARRTGGHPAKRSFQALRIEVNNELAILAPALESALDALTPGGRGFVLTYHSGEDRIAKDVFRRRSAQIDPPGLPVVSEEPKFALVRPLARKPKKSEVLQNRRSASARLRTIERLAA